MTIDQGQTPGRHRRSRVSEHIRAFLLYDQAVVAERVTVPAAVMNLSALSWFKILSCASLPPFKALVEECFAARVRIQYKC